MDVLNDLIDNKIEKKDDSLKKTLGENIAKSMEKCEHESDDKECESDDKKSSNSEGENQHYHSDRDYDSCDSEKEQNACFLAHPDSDSDCSDSETSVGSSYEKWLFKKMNRMKGSISDPE